MRIDKETPTLAVCTEGSRTFWRDKSAAFTGLSAEITVSAADGPLLRVTTGGPCAARFVPSGTNTPMQVQATYKLSGGVPDPVKVSLNFEFGARRRIPDELSLDVVWIVDGFVSHVVTTSPSFVIAWDRAVRTANARQADKAAEAASKSQDRALDALASAVHGVLCDLARDRGVPAPSPSAPAVEDAVATLAGLVADPVTVDAFAEDGADVRRDVIAHVSAQARARLESGDRLSEANFVALVTDQVLDQQPDAPVEVVAATVRVAYDVMHACVYGPVGFPDA